MPLFSFFPSFITIRRNTESFREAGKTSVKHLYDAMKNHESSERLAKGS